MSQPPASDGLPAATASCAAANAAARSRAPARDDDPLDRRHRRTDRRELRLGLPARADQPEGRRTGSGEVLRGDAARRARPNLAETVGRDQCRERARRPVRPVVEREEADDELERPSDDGVALETRDAESAVGRGHHREVPVVRPEPPARHQLDLTGGHPAEAVLDHPDRLAGRDE